jgi:thiosulfate/3-mercaptopyruvate sulfurtransferase
MSRADVLVDADWAEAHLEDPKIVFVEVDEDVSAYDGGHLAGAVRLDWTTELQQAEARDLIDQDDFSKLMSAKGISNDDTVVLYGGNNNWFAAYAYWQFKLYGTRTSSCSTAAARSGSSTGASSSRTSRSAGHQLHRAGAGPVDPRLPRRGHRLHRLEEPRRRPQPRRVQRQDQGAGAPAAGAVPAGRATCRPPSTSRGARRPPTTAPSAPTTSCRAVRRAGLPDGTPTIAYCRIGERSSHTWFVLHELLGKGDVKNYDGSWAEYGSLVGAPIAKDV